MTRALSTPALVASLLAGALGIGASRDAAAQVAAPAPASATASAAAPAGAKGLLEQLDDAVTSVVERAQPSVVQVVVRRAVALPDGNVQRDQVATSGVVWSADGLVVSLGRAFDAADAIEVVLPGGEGRPAELLNTDDETGLALLRIAPAGLREPLRPIELGTAKRLRAGSIVVAVSHPFGLAGSAVLGNVSGVGRVVKRGRMALTGVLQITVPVNPGDPGGLLVDCRGAAVGIVASTYERALVDPDMLGRMYRDVLRFGENLFGAQGKDGLRRSSDEEEGRFAGGQGPFGAAQGIAFAIPIDQAREVVERLRAGPMSERGWLGVQVVPLDAIAAAAEGLSGVAVVGVKDGSPAQKAGLLHHDIVLRYDGREVLTARDLKRLVLESPVGKPISIEVRRGEGKITLEAVLERRAVRPATGIPGNDASPK